MIDASAQTALLHSAIAMIPAHCRDVLYRRGYLIWAETGKSALAARETLLLYAEAEADALLLQEAQQRSQCFNFLTNLALLHCHVQCFGIACRTGIVQGGYYVSPPHLEEELLTSHTQLLGGRSEASLAETYAFVAQMLRELTRTLFHPSVAPQALQLLDLARECYVQQEKVLPRLPEIGTMFAGAELVVRKH